MPRGSRRGGIAGGTIEVRPSLAELKKRFDNLEKNFDDYRPVWDELAPVAINEIKGAISSQGASIGATWQPLSPAYRKRKGGGQLLRRTGALLASIGVISKAKRALRVGAKGLAYARALQFGKPPRPFVAATETMHKTFLDASDRFVVAQLKKAGW